MVKVPEHLSPLPWKYERWDWIEDAHGNIVVEHVGHIDGPFIVASANAALEPVAEAKAEPVAWAEGRSFRNFASPETNYQAVHLYKEDTAVPAIEGRRIPLYTTPPALTDRAVSPVAQQRDEGWQDIATAPKDGRDVHMYGRGVREGGKYAKGQHIGFWDAGSNCWFTKDPTVVCLATHWRPLPAPPALSPERKDQSNANG